MLNEQRLFKTVTINDPALDCDAMGGAGGMVAWAESRDFGALKLKHGVQPVVYYLRTLGGLRAHQLIGASTTDADAWVKAFRACVVRVDNFNGSPAWEPIRMRDGGGEAATLLLTETECDAFDIATIYEIGAAAYGLCFFPKGTDKRFQLPRLSGQIWDSRNVSRPVAEPVTTAGPSESKPDEG
jgi:hypothetical protein